MNGWFSTDRADLHTYRVRYRDISGEGPVWTTLMTGFSKQGVVEDFHDGDDGWEILSIKKVNRHNPEGS